MKKLSIVLMAIFFAITVNFAQTPNQFKYQAVLRDASGNIMANQDVTIDISILKGSANGTNVFDEQHKVTTTAQGLINLNIGSIDTNGLASINWSDDVYFIQITVNGKLMGTSQLLSVPYALQAKKVETIDYSQVANYLPTDISDLTDSAHLLFSGDYNDLKNLPTLFDGQWSSLTGTVPNISIFNNDAGYLTSETDSVFLSNIDVSGASQGDLLRFDGSKFVKFTPNYLTSYTETDPVFTSNFDLSNLSTGDLLKFDGSKFVKFTPNYLTSFTETDPAFDIFNITNPSSGQLLQYDTTTNKWINRTPNYLTSEKDSSITNEIQDLELSNNILRITNNTNATDIDLSVYLDNSDNQNLDSVLSYGNDGGGKQIKNIADPTDPQDAVTKAYVDLLEERIEELETQMILIQGVKDIDGNKYEVVKIGNQIWMAEDLKVKRYPNGDTIPYITDNTAWANLADNDTSDAYCFYDNNTSSDYGALYTYSAAIGDNWARDNKDGQGVCPDGWHLPTDAEWQELIDYITNDGHSGTEGVALKSTSGWNSSGNGTDDYGFTGLPGGMRHASDGLFYDEGNTGFWWSATNVSDTSASLKYLSYARDDVAPGSNYKSTGYRVRCVKD